MLDYRHHRCRPVTTDDRRSRHIGGLAAGGKRTHQERDGQDAATQYQTIGDCIAPPILSPDFRELIGSQHSFINAGSRGGSRGDIPGHSLLTSDRAHVKDLGRQT